MKIVITVLLSLMLIISCTSIEKTIDSMPGAARKAVNQEVVDAELVQEAEEAVAQPETEEPEPVVVETLPEDTHPTVTKQQVIDAVEAGDLELLETMLADVDDVKDIIGKDVPILVMAEESMGVFGVPNAVTEFLVEKKAYIYQRDEQGRDIERVIQDFGLAATPRHDYILSLKGDKVSRYYDAVKADSLDEIIALSDFVPVDSSMVLDAANYKAFEILKWAVAQDASVIGINNSGETPLHLLYKSCPDDEQLEAFLEAASVLLEAGADPDALDKSKRTPLIRLLWGNSIKNIKNAEALTKLLLENGADPQGKVEQGNTPFRYAVVGNHHELAQILIDFGATLEFNSTDILNMSFDSIDFYIGKGVDAALFTHWIQKESDSEAQMAFIEYIFDKGAKAGDFDVTYVRNNREVLQFLLDNGADINNGDIMIKYIYEKKSLEHFVYLVENGADLSRRYYGDSTVLHTAVGTRNLELVTYFVEQGAELNAVDNKSRTPLDRCSSRATDIIEYLIAAGAKKFEEL